MVRLHRTAGRTRLGERVRPAFFCPAGPTKPELRAFASLPMARRRFVALLFACTLAGCASRLTPPYVDVRHAGPSASADSLADALTDAGWSLAEPALPGVLTTAPRRIDGLARTTATLDVLPLGGRVVRLIVRAERRGLLGGRTKVFALSPAQRHAILGDTIAALRGRGLTPLTEARRRDEEATRP